MDLSYLAGRGGAGVFSLKVRIYRIKPVGADLAYLAGRDGSIVYSRKGRICIGCPPRACLVPSIGTHRSDMNHGWK